MLIICYFCPIITWTGMCRQFLGCSVFMFSFRGIDRYKWPKCTEVSNHNHNILFVSENFRLVFAKLRKVTSSFVMSVRPLGTTRHPLDGFSWNFIFEGFSKTCRKKSDKETGTLYECLCTVRSESRWALRLRWSPVEMWWHMVMHGRGSSESRCALIKGVGSCSTSDPALLKDTIEKHP